MGGTGHWPVPSGDSPDGTGRAANELNRRRPSVTPSHSARRVAERGGRVARATPAKRIRAESALNAASGDRPGTVRAPSVTPQTGRVVAGGSAVLISHAQLCDARA